MGSKICATCDRPKTGLWFLTSNCKVCRPQWRAFYAGLTQTSPLMRKITEEQSEALAKSHT